MSHKQRGMMRWSAPAALALALLTAGCDSRLGASRETQNQTAQPDLVGDWTATEPVVQQQDGGEVRISNMRVTYFKDNTYNSEADLEVSGPGIPPGLSFRMTGDGTWLRQGDVLRETIGNVAVSARQSDPGLQQMAAAIEQEYERQPSFNSDILELSRNRLRVRDRQTGKIVTMTR